VQVVAVANEHFVLLFVNLDIQVTSGSATGTDLPLGGQPHTHAIADTGRDLHADVASRPDPAIAALYYESARREGGLCEAVLDPRSLSLPSMHAQQTWVCKTTSKLVMFRHDHDALEFPFD